MPGMFGGGMSRGGSKSGKSSGGGRTASGRDSASGRKSKQGRRWNTGNPDDDASKKKGNKRRGWLAGLSSLGGDDKSKGKGSKDRGSGSPTPMDWAREAVLQIVLDPNAPPLKRIRAKYPWRSTSGKSSLIHPIGHDEFWKKFFGQQAALLRRGSWHRNVMTSSEAAGLLRGAKLGDDAEILGANIWSRNGDNAARRPSYSPEQGLPAVAALARGKPVRLLHIERKFPRMFRRDPLLAAMARLSPGRGISATIGWTPPSMRSIWEHEDMYDQVIVQVYGVRNWTVCTRGLPPPMREPQKSENSPEGLRTPKRQGKCVSSVLRHGDVLYLPSRTWHWTGSGPKAACHLTLGVMPLNGADLVMALGARNRLYEMTHPAMALPIPLWNHKNAEDAAELTMQMCFDLPWADAPMNTAVLCTLPSVRMALQRLSGSSGRSLPHWHPASGPVGPQPLNKPWPRARRKGIFSPLMEVIQPITQILGIIAVLLLFLCFCNAANSDEKSGKRKQGRTANQIRTERSMQRKSRVSIQQAARQKKLD